MDQVSILIMLEKLRNWYQVSPVVREHTLSVLGVVGQNDRQGQIRSCLDWVKGKIIYVNDPEGYEWLTSPERFISQYRAGKPMYGDCDCHCLMLGSMLGSIGFDVKFVGVVMKDTSDFNHVICGVMLDDRMQLEDPCAKLNPIHDYQKLLMVR
jgi:hypothetical protein